MDPLELLLKLSTFLDNAHRPVYNMTDETIRELAEDLKNFVEYIKYDEEQKQKLEDIRRIEDGEQE